MVRESDIEAIGRKLKSHTIPAAVATLATKRQRLTEPASCYGGTLWGRPDQKWPRCNDIPMIPLLQIRTNELPCKPAGLKRISLLTVFIDRNLQCESLSKEDDDLVVRSYGRLSSLQPLDRPEEVKQYKHFGIKWRLEQDFPDWEDIHPLLTGEESKIVRDLDSAGKNPFKHHACTKIGGWPSSLQVSIEGGKDYVMQVDSNHNHSFGDTGICYFWRSEIEHWYARWESL